jgi:hypothetical protein
MPYHDIGLAKYQALGMKCKLNNTLSTTNEQVAEVEKLLSGYRLPVIKHSGRAV